MLPNLNELVTPIVDKIEHFNILDCALPDVFKQNVTSIKNGTVEYGSSASCITNRYGQHIFLSNNWFYIAAILAPLYEPFNRYKDLLNQIVEKDVLKEANADRIKLAINSSNLEPQDKEYLIRFATDAKWWNGGNSNTGGKTLDRNDALVSAVLSIANLVNASQSYVATLWEFFGENPQYVELLNNRADSFIEGTSTVGIDEQGKALQKIYFGTPGSGKSNRVKKIVEPYKEDTFRTTFHPDSDYASFVGSYKPVVDTSGVTVPTNYTMEQLAGMLKQEYSDSTDKVVTLHSFTLKYVGYFNGEIADFNKRAFLTAANLSTSYDAEINKMVNLYDWMVENGMITKTNSISYEFVPQAFTDAYVAAWKDTTKPVYLVIEEINRGNCAQIFGDLFQLLDRGEDGKSEYSIKADKDLRKYLESDKGLGKYHEGIKNGELCLPANLRIYATMNTSDQSLFPMDSAFKRRWEWEYVPIDPDNADSQFIITIADKKYAWKDFLLAANERVKDVSESEDKQMGNFFIKDHIGKDEFVSKVMFYLWSEVCKDEYRARSFFHYKDGNNDEFSFNELFQKDENGVKKDVALLQGFMNYLGVKEI